MDSCADPAVIRGQKQGDSHWYLYCTTDPLNDADLDSRGNLIFHRIPQMRSANLTDWEYLGDAFAPGPDDLPVFAEPDAALWAPDVVYSQADNGDGDGQYLLFFGVTDTVATQSGAPDCGSDGAIGVAFGESPIGPWVFAERPVVKPRRGAAGCNFKWTFDPDVLGDRIGTQGRLYYGSYYGGVFSAPFDLRIDGSPSTPDQVLVDAAGATMVAIDNRYEGATVIERDGWFYMFVSATDCCNGALTGYTTLVGRARSPDGSFIDRLGQSLLDAAPGGSPFLVMTGDRWVGTGHNIVVQDEVGVWWTFYHAVDRLDPFFPGAIPAGGRGFTRRPAMREAVIWTDGWPTVAHIAADHVPGALMREISDEFDATLDGWTWKAGTNAGPEPEHSVTDGVLKMRVQTADTYLDVNSAHVLVRPAPAGDFVAETRLRTTLPDGCCFNYAQAGLGLMQDEDNLVKLTETAIFNTRQTEWAKEIGADRVAPGWSRYGNTVIGPPAAEWTYLRVAVEQREQTREDADTHRFTAYTSTNGADWVRGGSWTHSLKDASIALFAMGRQPPEPDETTSPMTAAFDYLRVYELETAP